MNDLNGTPRITDTPTRHGDQAGMLGVAITTTHANTRVQVQVDLPGLADPSQYETVIPDSGVRVEIYPRMLFQYDKLPSIQQPMPVNATFHVTADGVPLGEQALVLRVRSAHDAPFRW